MNSIGSKIFEIRRSKGLTQEELAELSKINLRTIQRIENNESEPREKTLNLICNVLDVNSIDLIEKEKRIIDKIGSIILNGLFLVLINLALMLILGFLTMELQANFNSRLGAFLLSFFIPFFIVYWTPNTKGLYRLFKFGSGYIIYFFMVLVSQGVGPALREGLTVTFLIPCIIISVGVLYYGDFLLKSKK